MKIELSNSRGNRTVAMLRRLRIAYAAMLLPLLLLLVLPTAVQAQDFTYTINSDNTIAITEYTGPGGDVTVPNRINGMSVTSIGDGVFIGCTNLTSVTIADSVNSIGDGAFAGCVKLTNISIPDSVVNLGPGPCSPFVFQDCTSLTRVVIGNSVSFIGGFYQCYNLTSVYFEGNAPILSSSAFNGANNVILYYLPGTTGWTNLDGYHTSLWRPQISSDSSFGLQSNQLNFKINWVSGMVAVVEACTNLTTSSWVPVQTNVMTSDSFCFSDSMWTNHACRFYRIRWQ